MSYTEKMDVLDMLINVIREHEEKLDELVSRLERVVEIDKPNKIDMKEFLSFIKFNAPVKSNPPNYIVISVNDNAKRMLREKEIHEQADKDFNYHIGMNQKLNTWVLYKIPINVVKS